MAIVVDNKFNFWDRVYLVTDPEQKERIITLMQVSGQGQVTYGVACGEDFQWFFTEELSKEKVNIFKT